MLLWTLVMMLIGAAECQFPIVDDVSEVINDSTLSQLSDEYIDINSLYADLSAAYINLRQCTPSSPGVNGTVPSLRTFYKDLKRIRRLEEDSELIDRLLLSLPGVYYNFYLELICEEKAPKMFETLLAMKNNGICDSLPVEEAKKWHKSLSTLMVNSVLREICDFPQTTFLAVSSAYLFDQSEDLLSRDEILLQIKLISAALFNSPLRPIHSRIIVEYFKTLLAHFPLRISSRMGGCEPGIHPSCPFYRCFGESQAAGRTRDRTLSEHERIRMSSAITTICTQMAAVSRNYAPHQLFVPLEAMRDPLQNTYRIDNICPLFAAPGMAKGGLSNIASACQQSPYRPMSVHSALTQPKAPFPLCKMLENPQDSVYLGTFAALASMCMQ